jgi:hypothetical protein
MADTNDFLAKLFASQKPPVPLRDPSVPVTKAQENDEFAESPEDNMPALEEPVLGQMPKPDLAKREEILGNYKSFKPDEDELQQHLDKMGNNDNSRIDREIASSDFDQKAMESLPEMIQSSPQAALLSDFQRLKNAQDKQLQDQKNIRLRAAARGFADSVAAGHGANIDDEKEFVNREMKFAAQPVQDIMTQMKLGGSDANDPNSDVSKFAREQAVNVMARLNPKINREEYLKKFEGMSAAQLEKLGFKGSGNVGTIRPFTPTDRTTMNGEPIKFDPNTGQWLAGNAGRPIGDNEAVPRDIARKLDQSGNYGYVTPKGAIEVGTSKTAQKVPAPQVDEDTGEALPTQVKEGDINQINPKIYKENFLKAREDLMHDKDIEQARKVNQNATNILSKVNALEPGKPVDSGIAEALAAQAGSISVGGGRLAEGVIKEFGGAGGIENTIKRYTTKMINGQMTPEDIKFFRDFALKMQTAAAQDAQDKSQIYIDRVKSLPGFEGSIDNQNAAKLLNLDNLMKNTYVDKYNQMQTDSKKGEVKRLDPKTGRTAVFNAKTKQFLRWDDGK